ncbi:hypothetical protein DEVEQU_00471 [Devosia equisanguinis]|uniref:SHOCT domain-containing protein n=1 Tax=Devosia equisanguinis TaxID=2490941 RepID=A0A3S4GFI3_9HYPH|nr:superinfection immunity protein [Devosia equisanguinis]VDS03350.1 hypothetical protein DEVEQU_00471 [Devosia equisanguinis]
MSLPSVPLLNAARVQRGNRIGKFVLPLFLAPTATAFAQADPDSGPALQFLTVMGVSIVLLVAGLIILFIPAYIAFRRHHPNRWAIAVVCLAFGGTVIGWFGALIWALHAVHQTPYGSRGGESGLNIFADDVTKVRIEPDLARSKASDVDTLAERLGRLKKLFETGVITEEEHAALRQRALAEIGA